MVSIDNLTSEIVKQVSLYTNEVEKKVRNAENKVAKEAVEELKQKSPKGDTGRYAEGWDKKRVDGKLVIYNKSKPGLPHLLENGHAKVGGGRTAAIPHIRPVEEEAISKFTELVEKAIKQ